MEKAGGQVLYWNGHRVMGVLAMSRAIGDHGLRPYIIPEPEVSPQCTLHCYFSVPCVARECVFGGATACRFVSCPDPLCAPLPPLLNHRYPLLIAPMRMSSFCWPATACGT